MTKRYYYRFDTSSPLGKKFRSLWNECNKAQRAAETFRKKVKACGICPNDEMFAGGVEGVYFDNDKKVNRKIWREDGKADDGTICWMPICKKREKVTMLHSEDFQPSNTATRIYDKQTMTWEKAKHLLTNKEWCEMADTDEEELDAKMEKEHFVRYIELYRDDEMAPTCDKRWKMSWAARESIRIEKQRILLPVVDTRRFYQLLQADLLSGQEEGTEVSILKLVTPTFFEYSTRFFFGSPYPCKAEGLEQVEEGDYIQRMLAMRQMQRDMEALKKQE